MTEGEKMVWAAVYALEYREMSNDDLEDLPVDECMLMAWGAVNDMRKTREKVAKGWGQDDDITIMLDEMLS